jgi:hypothetical protein
MKAKQVNEFEQGLDPYDAMKIGKNHKGNHTFSMGDRIELLDDIWSVDADEIKRQAQTLYGEDSTIHIKGDRIDNIVYKLLKKGDIMEYDGDGYDEDEEQDMGTFYGGDGWDLSATWLLKNKSVFKKL